MEALAQRLAAVRERIVRAAGRAGRDPGQITLLAVTKVFPADAIRRAYELGLREFGENYVQEFEGKAPQVGDLEGARFHLIGHLQSNKSQRAAELFQVVQTVDSPRLARRLDAAGRILDVMLEVKLSPEEGKSGAGPEKLADLIAAVRECANLRLLGLMTMPPWSEDVEASRPYFRQLRELAHEHGLTQLSMGMSHDLEAAIEEGATCVRVGTALFGEPAEGVTAGLYSPLPPARTGVADYSSALLAELRRHGRVAVSPRHCDVALYHLGNNALHAGIYRRALEQPGVVVLHDAVLHHFLLGQLGADDYVEEFVYNYGEWSRDLARELWRGRAASGADRRYFELPMLRRIAERARAIVVHNPAAAGSVRRHAPAARVIEIPHLFQPPDLPPLAEILRFRARLGAPAAFLFGIFGYLRESKRLATVLEAFADVHRELPGTALLVAGQFVSRDLEKAVAPLLAGPGIVRLPYLAERDFWLAAAATDACINLRYPAAGETSGIAIRLMGIGKPVLISESLENAAFPQDASIRVPTGVGERDSLRKHMILLTSMNEVAHHIGRRGAEHIQARHRVDQAGEQYWNLLCDLCA